MLRARLDDTGRSPTVSVIIPVYNRLTFLDQAVESALTQTYPKIEVVVVDDGSVVDVRRPAERFGPRVRYVRQENNGQASARNHGLRLARGEYCLFLDDDDFLEHLALEELVGALAGRPGAAWVVGGVGHVDEGGRRLPAPHRRQISPGDAYPMMIHCNCIETPSAVLIRTEVLRESGGFVEDRRFQYCEDFDLWLTLARDYPVVAVPRVVTNYRQYAGQGTAHWERRHQPRLEVLLKGRGACRPGFHDEFTRAIGAAEMALGDALYVSGNCGAAREHWRNALTPHGLAADWRMRVRFAKSYLPKCVIDRLRSAARVFRQGPSASRV
jgi:glycosyltransferase involved in cell wall biosynthesis